MASSSSARGVKIVYGTMEVGRRMGFEESQKVIELFMGKGYNELDTARMYADGMSEKMLGDLPSSIKSKAIIATKANPLAGLLRLGARLQVVDDRCCRSQCVWNDKPDGRIFRVLEGAVC
eukprot:m.79701 g.79701  ORF g.79701 m.79701 type:complete len:120 (+) comp36148_c0_seq8:380-739(+)